MPKEEDENEAEKRKEERWPPLPRKRTSDANSHESVTEAICRARSELAAGSYDPLPIANARMACKST